MSTEQADVMDQGGPAESSASASDTLALRGVASGELARPAPALDPSVQAASSGAVGPAAPRRPLLRRVHTLDSMRSADFRRLWLANLSLSGAAWLQDLVVGWLTFDKTGSPFLTALAVGLVTLPYIFAAPLGGLIADLWDRKTLIATAGVYQAAVTSVFAWLLIFDALQTWMIFVYILAIGVSWAMSEPARAATVPDVVPKRGLMNAFALNALAFNSTRLVVPVVGGLMMVWVGPGPTILWGAALYFISSLTVMGMTITRRESDEERPARGIARLVEAARFVFSEPIAVLVVGLAALQLVIVMPFVHGLLPVYAADVFDMGPAGLGMLMSALGAGAAIGTITLASFGEVARKGRLLVVVMSGNLIAMVALAQSGGVLHPALAMFALGGATAAQFSIGGAIVLGMTPESLRGRVSALSMMVLGLFPAGALVAGGLAEAFSAPTATLIGAGAIVVVLAALRGPLVGLWRLSDTDA